MPRFLLLRFFYTAVGLFTFVLSSARAQEVYLSDIQELSVTGSRKSYCNPLCKDMVTEGDNVNPVTIEGRKFDKGLAVLPQHNGVAIIKYALDGKYRKLEFYGGISDYAGNSWSEWALVDENGRLLKLDRKKTESLTHVKIGAGASISVFGDGRQIGDTLFVNARTQPELSSYDVSGIQELALHLSAWGIEPCDAPYHSGGTYPGCPRLLGSDWCDFIQLGDPKLIAGPDDEPPELKSVAPLSETSVKVLFNESVTQASAEKTGNYSISNGITVTGASLDSDNTSVRLTTSAMSLKNTYTLTVSNITDRSKTPNTMQQQSMSFTYLEGIPLDDGYFTELLCLENSQNSLCLSKSAASDIEQKYAGNGKVIPFDGQTITAGGETCRWALRTDNNGTWADGSQDNFVAFWHVTIVSPSHQQVKLAYRHDDDITAWHNGVAVVSATGWDNDSEQRSKVFSLVEGDNHFLFKLLENGGGNRFAAKIISDQNNTVPGLLYRFPEQSSTIYTGKSGWNTAGPVCASVLLHAGTHLTVSRLHPHCDYTISLSDACGRVAVIRSASGPDGCISLSTADRPRGVYVVGIRSLFHSMSFTTVLP